MIFLLNEHIDENKTVVTFEIAKRFLYFRYHSENKNLTNITTRVFPKANTENS